MAIETNIGGSNKDLFVGEDKTFRLTMPNVNIAGWSILWVVRTTDSAADPAIFSKTATITGTFNVDQLAFVMLTDTEMNTVTARIYRYSWKRMDDGSETVLAFGNMVPLRVTAR